MKKLELKDVIYMSLVAAIYVALTVVLAPIAYGPIQFRFSEILVLLVLYNKKYILPLTVGVLIANSQSPLGWVDMVFGTTATLISLLAMRLVIVTTKNKYVAAFMPVIINAIIIGAMLSIYIGIPLFMTMFQVGVGQFVVIMIAGLAIFRSLERHDVFAKEVLGIEPVTQEEKFSIVNVFNTAGFAVVIMLSVFFFRTPIFQEPLEQNLYWTLSYMAFEDFNATGWLVWALILPMLTLITLTFMKCIIGLIVSFLIVAGTITIAVLGINNVFYAWQELHVLSLTVYGLTLVSLLCLQFLQFKNNKKA